MKKIIGLLVLCFVISHSLSAQTLVSAEIQKNSSLTINGSTNLITFKLHQNAENLSNGRLKVATAFFQNKIFLSQNQLTVSVKNFTSNNFIALREFFKLVKSDSYPTLQVQMNFPDALAIAEKAQSYNGNALINITITGITKQYSIPISLKTNGNQFVLEGNKKLNIHDFGLKAEPKMMGLIIINEWIDIDFHIIYKIKSDIDYAKQ